jgi:hypothetical protein
MPVLFRMVVFIRVSLVSGKQETAGALGEMRVLNECLVEIRRTMRLLAGDNRGSQRDRRTGIE